MVYYKIKLINKKKYCNYRILNNKSSSYRIGLRKFNKIKVLLVDL